MSTSKSRRLPAVVFGILLVALTASFISTASTPTAQTILTVRPIITIPADITERGLVFLRARVNRSKPLWFVLDSGANFAFVVDKRRADALALRAFETTKGSGAGADEFEIGSTNGLNVILGGLPFQNASAAIISLSAIEAQAGRPIEGLVGSQLFVRLVVEIDYFNESVTLYNPATYKYSGSGQSTPLTMEGDYLFIPASIQASGGRSFDGRYLIDTGGGWVTAILTTPFSRSKNFPSRQDPMIVDRSLAGLGGETQLVMSRATGFQIGKFVIRNPVLYASRDDAGALATTEFDGIIGSEVLRRFKVIFDYPHRQLILEPNAHFNDPTEADMSGIRLRAGGDRLRNYRVFQLIQNSPAIEAGLQVGDLLVDVDGRSSARYSMDEIYELFKQPGREYKLTVRRGRRKFDVRMRLRRLV